MAHPAVALACLLGLLFSAAASATPRLSCQLTQGGEVQILNFAPTTDPYSAKPVNIRDNFRFKAVVIGNDQKIDYITLNTYYISRRQAVLLHQAKYLNPLPDEAPSTTGLTGTTTVYSPQLGREFQYGCALLEVTP